MHCYFKELRIVKITILVAPTNIEINQEEKNLERERLVFFSDAVIAIAMTLLALELKVKPAGLHFTYSDIGVAWHTFAAFFLSFIIIAVFWINHHRFFVHIQAIDPRITTYRCAGRRLLCLPFTSSLISEDFFNKPAMVLYSANVLMVTYFQNAIWDHASGHKELMKPTITAAVEREYRIGCNLAMGNAIFAIAVTFFSPLFAFITLFTRTFMFRQSAQQWVARLTRKRIAKEESTSRSKS